MPLQNVSYNATTSALSSMGGGFSWVLTILIFLGILLTLLLFSKNIRQFFYGAIVSGSLTGIYFLSHWIGFSATKNNLNPLKWAVYIMGFIVVSIFVGKLLQKLKFIKNLEKQLK
jgi:hypothetical protein